MSDILSSDSHFPLGKPRAERPAPSADSFPDNIDGHRILRVLGQGGMGIVYLAEDPQLPRLVALKVLSEKASISSDTKRFIEEARLTGHLAHPGIVPVYRFGEAYDPSRPDTPLRYFTMKPVHGKSLADILDDLAREIPSVVEAYPIRRLLTIFLKVCETVAFAHSRGVIHRDLKPSNIMVGDYGEVMLMDWGLSKVLPASADRPLSDDPEMPPPPTLSDSDGNSGITEYGAIVGTPSFMAPEQATGREELIDELSDVYGLGALLYSMLTLWPPVSYNDINRTLKAVAVGDIEPPEQRAPERGIEPCLARICMLAMELDRTKRTQTASEIVEAIQDYLEGRAPWVDSLTLAHETSDDGQRLSSLLRTVRGQFRPYGNNGVRVESSGEALIVCRKPFHGNVRVSCIAGCDRDVTSPPALGVVLARPDNDGAGDDINKGYIFRIGADDNTATKLSRDVTDVLIVPDFVVIPGQTYRISVEKSDDRVILKIDDYRICEYRDFLPLSGEIIGFYASDSRAFFDDIRIEAQGKSLHVSALSVPDSFFHAGDFARAADGYREIASAHDGRLEGWLATYKQALCLHRQKKNADARALFESLSTTSIGALGLQGAARVALDDSDMDAVIEYLERCAVEFTGDPALATVSAYTWDQAELFRIGQQRPLDRARAIALYQLALSFDPTRGIYHFRKLITIAESYLALGKFDDAMAAFQDVLDNAPKASLEYNKAEIGQARVRLERGEIDNAAEGFRAIIQQPAGSNATLIGEAHYYLAQALDAAGRSSEAMEAASQIETGSVSNATLVRARILEAFCLFELNLRDAAFSLLQSVEDWDGATNADKLQARLGAVRLDVVANDYRSAQERIARIVADPSLNDVSAALALSEQTIVAWLSRDMNLALRCAQRVVSEHPTVRGDVWTAWLLCSLCLHSIGQIVEATVLLRKATDIDDHSGRTIMRYAMKEIGINELTDHILKNAPYTERGRIAFWAAETARARGLIKDAQTLYRIVLDSTPEKRFPRAQAKIQLESL